MSVALDAGPGQVLTALAEIEASSGDRATARELAQQALTVHQATGHRLGAERAYRVLDSAGVTDKTPVRPG